MKSDLTLNSIAAFTLVLMVTVSFLSFYQTSLGQYIITYICQLFLAYIPYFAVLGQIIIPLIFALYAVVAFLIYFLKPKKIKSLQNLAFLPLIPAILSFSTSSWLWQLPTLLLGFPLPTIPQETSFLLLSIYGIIILSCIIVLKFILKIKETRKELLFRGGNPLEVKKALVGSFSCLLISLGVSVCLTITAALVLIFAQPIGITLIQMTPYATIFLGIGFLTLLCVLVYYYLKQNR